MLLNSKTIQKIKIILKSWKNLKRTFINADQEQASKVMHQHEIASAGA